MCTENHENRGPIKKSVIKNTHANIVDNQTLDSIVKLRLNI